MFKSAYLRLTAWYVVIIMAISLLFSFWVYVEADKELSASLDRQGFVIRQRIIDDFAPSLSRLEQIRDEQLARARSHILFNLFYFNLFVLGAGAAASYWLAQRTMQPLKESMEAQHRFTADASHELRTPLAAMRAEIEVALRDKNLSMAEARELLDSNLEEIAKLEILSGSLLRLARYQDNHATLTFKKTRLKPLIAKTVKSLAPVAKAQNLTIQQAVQDVEIDADAAALQEVLRILLDNAIKYSPQGGEVQVGATVDDQRAVIQVQDHGIGIKASAIPHLFERFYREDSSRTKGHIKGFGLGLSIAKTIVDNHQGSISVTSTPQQGSTFTVKLPISHKSQAD